MRQPIGLLENPTVNFSLLEEFTGGDGEQLPGFDLKPSKVNTKAHLFLESADQFLHQQATAVQSSITLTSIAAESEMAVQKNLVVEDLTTISKAPVIDS